jgi:hypothetical protein
VDKLMAKMCTENCFFNSSEASTFFLQHASQLIVAVEQGQLNPIFLQIQQAREQQAKQENESEFSKCTS